MNVSVPIWVGALGFRRVSAVRSFAIKRLSVRKPTVAVAAQFRMLEGKLTTHAGPVAAAETPGGNGAAAVQSAFNETPTAPEVRREARRDWSMSAPAIDPSETFAPVSAPSTKWLPVK